MTALHVNNDYDEYLKSLSLQTNIRRSPKNHVFLSSKDYIKLLNRLKSEDVIKNFEIYKRKPISDSSSNNIVSLGTIHSKGVSGFLLCSFMLFMFMLKKFVIGVFFFSTTL